MSLTDYEIMGGIGYGSDPLAGMDLRAAMIEQAFPPLVKPRHVVPFNVGLDGLSTYRERYQPIEQEPMGRSYRPDQFSSSELNYNYYKYPAWNKDDPVYGIKYEYDSIKNSNALAVENAFQTETARYGGNENVNRIAGHDQRMNSYSRYDASNLANATPKSDEVAALLSPPNYRAGLVERFQSGLDSGVEYCQNNTTILLIILMFLVFVIVAYLQNNHIKRLQKMLKHVLTKTSIH